MTGIRRREKPGRLAPAKRAERIAQLPTEEAKRERKRLADLKEELYGEVAFTAEAFVMPDDAETETKAHPPGGFRGGKCCSHRWADDVWDGAANYPPGHGRTAMVACAKCRALVPPSYLGSSGHCHDCRFEFNPPQSDRMQASSSVLFINDLRRRH